ncbi:MAG: hypothetical protein K0S65_5696 [Labilithrix sp.]|nr:hypothetical protein [Labilithrix sp.]
MSTPPDDKSALVAQVSDAYDPTERDAERVFAKVKSALPVRATRGALARLLGGVGISSMALVLASGALLYARRTEEPKPSRSPRVELVSVAPSANDVPPLESESVLDAPAISVNALPSAPMVPTTRPALPAPPVASSAPSDTLEREARLLADARRALQGGDAVRALALLDEHAQVFPDGFLASDRGAERIEVLCSLGRRDEAVRDAKAFLAGRPRTPLAHRVELSCARHISSP